jgi:pimeloyl-ACP methyl ester carboxylesterase
MSASPQARQFSIDRGGWRIAGEEAGEGPPVVLLHGLTATRRYVVHGSRALPRAGYRTIAFDARGHGASDPPTEGGYSYAELAADLGAVLDELLGERRAVLSGHSMGAHTLAAYALAHPGHVAGIAAIGPTFVGAVPTPESLAGWDALADGLESGGVDGFVRVYDQGLDPEWRETLIRIARERLSRHRHPEAVARALREIPRSAPFEDLAELELLDLPALVVASRDEADPGHPYAAAEAWSERLPRATLISEDAGASPLAWQGGRLSREIAAFCKRADFGTRR